MRFGVVSSAAMVGRRWWAETVVVVKVVLVVVVMWILPNVTKATGKCNDGFAFRSNNNNNNNNNTTAVQLECHKEQWRAVAMDKVPDVCLAKPVPQCKDGGTCRGRSRRETPHPTGKTHAKKALCSEPPPTPANMVLTRSVDGYLATCKKGYAFSSPLIQSMAIRCEAGVWTKNHTHTCRPQCTDQCQNGGTCIDMETCLCPPGTEGPKCGTLVWGTCRAEVKWQNVIVKAILQGLLLQCPRGYKLLQYKPYEHWLLRCQAGKFEEPPGITWDQENPCHPVCEPPCPDGAVCVAPGKCDCGDEISCSDCEKRQLCTPPVVRHGTAYRLAPHLTRVSCFGGRLPTEKSRNLLLRCAEDEWVTSNNKPLPHNEVNCSFACHPKCKNGGRCVGPNKCRCPSDQAGPLCSHPVCGTMPLTVKHAQHNLTSSSDFASGTIRCNDGYRLPSEEQETSFQCRDQVWQFSGGMVGHKSLECHPLCDPPCLNHGACVAPDSCVCREGFIGKKCELRPSMTTDGGRCLFPFSYGHKIHDSCITADRKLPWCATQVSRDGAPLTWQYCNTTHHLEKVVGTISGRTCLLPFKWNDVMWWQCARDDKGRSWCATQVTSDGRVAQRDYCRLDHGYQRVTVTTNGMLCNIPYLYGEMRHYSCYGDGKKTEKWCPTKIRDDLTPLQWGICVPGQGTPDTHPDWHSSSSCLGPPDSTLGVTALDPCPPFPLLPTPTTTTPSTTTAQLIHTLLTNQMPTIIMPRVPGIPPLPPLVSPVFPLPRSLVEQPPPPTPTPSAPLLLQQPPPLPRMPFIPPPPPPLPPPILLIQPVPQPIPVLVAPPLLPQPLLPLPLLPIQPLPTTLRPPSLSHRGEKSLSYDHYGDELPLRPSQLPPPPPRSLPTRPERVTPLQPRSRIRPLPSPPPSLQVKPQTRPLPYPPPLSQEKRRKRPHSSSLSPSRRQPRLLSHPSPPTTPQKEPQPQKPRLRPRSSPPPPPEEEPRPREGPHLSPLPPPEEEPRPRERPHPSPPPPSQEEPQERPRQRPHPSSPPPPEEEPREQPRQRPSPSPLSQEEPQERPRQRPHPSPPPPSQEEPQERPRQRPHPSPAPPPQEEPQERPRQRPHPSPPPPSEEEPQEGPRQRPHPSPPPPSEEELQKRPRQRPHPSPPQPPSQEEPQERPRQRPHPSPPPPPDEEPRERPRQRPSPSPPSQEEPQERPRQRPHPSPAPPSQEELQERPRQRPHPSPPPPSEEEPQERPGQRPYQSPPPPSQEEPQERPRQRPHPSPPQPSEEEPQERPRQRPHPSPPPPTPPPQEEPQLRPQKPRERLHPSPPRTRRPRPRKPRLRPHPLPSPPPP